MWANSAAQTIVFRDRRIHWTVWENNSNWISIVFARYKAKLVVVVSDTGGVVGCVDFNNYHNYITRCRCLCVYVSMMRSFPLSENKSITHIFVDALTNYTPTRPAKW